LWHPVIRSILNLVYSRTTIVISVIGRLLIIGAVIIPCSVAYSGIIIRNCYGVRPRNVWFIVIGIAVVAWGIRVIRTVYRLYIVVGIVVRWIVVIPPGIIPIVTRVVVRRIIVPSVIPVVIRGRIVGIPAVVIPAVIVIAIIIRRIIVPSVISVVIRGRIVVIPAIVISAVIVIAIIIRRIIVPAIIGVAPTIINAYGNSIIAVAVVPSAPTMVAIVIVYIGYIVNYSYPLVVGEIVIYNIMVEIWPGHVPAGNKVPTPLRRCPAISVCIGSQWGPAIIIT